jgi:hypothetical protein
MAICTSILDSPLVITSPLAIFKSGAEAIASCSQYGRQPLPLLGSANGITKTTWISYAEHSSCSLAQCSSNHRNHHTSDQVILESVDVVALEREEDHVIWVDLAPKAFSFDDEILKITRLSYLQAGSVLRWACELFFLGYPEHWVSSGLFSDQDSYLATILRRRYSSRNQFSSRSLSRAELAAHSPSH